MVKKSYYPQPNQNLDFAALERDILKFWQENKVFEKSVEMRDIASAEDDEVSPVKETCALKDHAGCRHDNDERPEFVFYDGPPFANGLPHYGHLLTGFIKDLVARYQTMKGKKVERRFGWDTHGLPVEMETEKELGVSGQIAIQEYGIGKFNDACRVSVMKYADDWKEYVTRQGRFVDFDGGYKTMDANYMESVLWAFKSLYDKGLMYEDFRVVPYSWACQTPLSNFETKMDNSYREKASKAVTVKFELTDESAKKLGFEGKKVSLVAWTTTPWTLPSNLGLAVGANIEYAALSIGDKEILVIAKNLIAKFAKDFGLNEEDSTENLQIVKGSELVALKYKPLFPYLANHEKIVGNKAAFSVLHGDFVSTDEGTGIVHMAPGFGEDDQILCKANGIPTLCPVDEGGKFTAEIKEVVYNAENSYTYLYIVESETKKIIAFEHPGKILKKVENDHIYYSDAEYAEKKGGSPLQSDDFSVFFSQEDFDDFLSKKGLQKFSLKGIQVFDTNDDIIKYLKTTNAWIKTEQILHNYPHCWRTDTPLIYKAVSSWYVEVTKFKDRMVELNSGKPVFKQAELPTTIETARIRGEVVSQKHHADIVKMLADKEVRNFYYYAPHQVCNEEQAFENIKYYEDQWQKGLPRFALFDKQSGDFIGVSGFCFYDPKQENFENGNVEISYQFTKPTWGKGFASEFMQGLIDYAYKYYPVDSVCAATVSDNLGSKKVLEKAGFKLIRKGKNTYPKAGKDKQHEEHYHELKLARQGINWIPDHIKDGQFGKWLEGARDWSISRNRFWGCPVPVWVSDNPLVKKIKVFGSLKEIEQYFGHLPLDEKGEPNLHRPYIDELVKEEICEKTGEKYKMKRVTDVLDCWFESGSMPYAQVHYPFENKEWFEENFPADFITEYVAQTRGWFYTMMVLSTALFDRAPFKNVICHGTILDENAQKLSKRLRNYPDPVAMFDEIGSDSLRFFMASQPVMRGQELKIDKDGKAFRDTLRQSIKPLINAYNFFCLYANSDGIKAKRIEYQREFSSVLDKYILAKLKDSVTQIDKAMANYDTIKACDEFNKFFEALNNWYIRRSRQRFWKSEIDQDKQDAYDVLYTSLISMCEASAPILPFTTEFVWKGLSEAK